MKIMKKEEKLILTPRKLKIIKCWALWGKKNKTTPKDHQTLHKLLEAVTNSSFLQLKPVTSAAFPIENYRPAH